MPFSVLKMALLGTAGELLLARLTRGRYLVERLGLPHRLWIWGALGLAIFCAFEIFPAGVGALFFHSATVTSPGMKILRAR